MHVILGFIHGIDMTILKKVVYELTVEDTTANKYPSTGIQLCVSVGSSLKKGNFVMSNSTLHILKRSTKVCL